MACIYQINKQSPQEYPKPKAVNEMRFNFKTSFKLVIYLIDTVGLCWPCFVMNTELKLKSKTHCQILRLGRYTYLLPTYILISVSNHKHNHVKRIFRLGTIIIIYYTRTQYHACTFLFVNNWNLRDFEGLYLIILIH